MPVVKCETSKNAKLTRYVGSFTPLLAPFSHSETFPASKQGPPPIPHIPIKNK